MELWEEREAGIKYTSVRALRLGSDRTDHFGIAAPAFLFNALWWV